MRNLLLPSPVPDTLLHIIRHWSPELLKGVKNEMTESADAGVSLSSAKNVVDVLATLLCSIFSVNATIFIRISSKQDPLYGDNGKVQQR